MTVTPWAGFIADFPDDQVEGGGRRMEVLGGRNVAVALGEMLIGLGCQVSTLDYAGLKGWEFELYYQRHRFWCQVTSFHPAFYLLFDDPAITRATRAKNAAAYAEIWRKLADALEQDPRFHDVEWRSMEDGPPEPEQIGEASAREGVAGIPLEPLKPTLRPEPIPRRSSYLGCLPMMVAASGGMVGAAGGIGGVIGLVLGRSGAAIQALLGVVIFCLSALSFWALLRGPRRRKVAASDQTT
ncbi:MAG TPA: hypothetical protein VHN39_02280 [Phenylobacterium sp.]|jgi:hypothetical protein|nr:hypothetical protein [Phenylobacterium sp.]